MSAPEEPALTIPVKRPGHAHRAVAANPDAARPYLFGVEIARGGMGSVLEAEDCRLPRTVAVKVILSEMDADEGQKQRFMNEAAVLARLAHPNIVPVYDIGRDPAGQLYYSMKLVKGRTLQAIHRDIRDGAPGAARQSSLDRLLTIFRKVCDAVAFAHSQGIIHRDLKPENVMVGEFGEVLVMDWGLAKILRDEAGKVSDENAEAVASSFIPHPSSFDVTLEGSVMGTPQYMSPEQAEGRIADMDARSDIFTLGGILYAMLTLQPPVEGRTLDEVLKKVSSGAITPPSAFGSTTGRGKPRTRGEVVEPKEIKPLPHCPGGRVPAALSAVAMKALSVDREKRYQDVAALSADVEAFQNGFATSAENAGAWRQFTLFVKRNKAATLGVAAVLLVGGGFGTNAVIEGRRANRALSDLRKSAPAMLQLAESEADSQRFDSALSKIDAALALDPALLRAWWQRAWVFLALERWSDAMDALRVAQRHEPEFLGHTAGARPANPGAAHPPDDILPAVQKMAATSEEERWKGDDAREVFRHLESVGATGPMLAFAGKLMLGAEDRRKLADERLLNSLGAHNYALSIESDGVVFANVYGRPLHSLEPFRGLPIDKLDAANTAISDLEPLHGMHLRNLAIQGTKVADLAPLRGMPLGQLIIERTAVRDLSPLAGMPLRILRMSLAKVVDLTPLAGMPLVELAIFKTGVSRLDALRGMPLVKLEASSNTRLSDCSALRGAPLESLTLSDTRVSDLSFLQGMPLRTLNLNSAPVSDLSALRGLPLWTLLLENTLITDLSAIEGGSLREINIRGCKKLTNFAPILSLQLLERLTCDVLPESLLPLRQSKTLEFIDAEAYPGEGFHGARPVAEFWRVLDVQQRSR